MLPGVTAVARSAALIEEARTAVSDGSGQYLIISLESGTYTVTFTLPGFSTFVRDGIELIGSATATVDGQLQIGALDETITVSGAAPLVDVQGVAQQSVMTREVIDSIPTGKAFNNLGVLVPGMVTGTTYGVGQDVGGQSGQSHQRMAIHVGQESDQRIMVDGMSMSPWTQEDASLVWFSDGNFEEVEVNHSVISAESELGGVQFNMIPRSGGNTFSSRNSLNFSAQSLQRNNLTPELIAAGLPEPNRLKTLWSVNPSVGGPIAQDRLWFFTSYTHQVADSFVAFFEDVDPNAGSYTASADQAFDDQWVNDASIRLTWQATDKGQGPVLFRQEHQPPWAFSRRLGALGQRHAELVGGPGRRQRDVSGDLDLGDKQPVAARGRRRDPHWSAGFSGPVECGPRPWLGSWKLALASPRPEGSPGGSRADGTGSSASPTPTPAPPCRT